MDEAVKTVFVLGGGGQLGAHEVGMLRALAERGVRADAVVGTSIGAINGAFYAADPSVEGIARLENVWAESGSVFGDSLSDRVQLLARRSTHLFRSDRLRELLAGGLPATFEELSVPFQCVAASIETASTHYFESGPLYEPLIASSAVPGLLPPVEIDGHHYLDGGLVASIPLDRAFELGATEVYVLQVGRVEEPLTAPGNPLEVAAVAFEISRRHRFVEALASTPDDVTVHLLPTGAPTSFNDVGQYRPSLGSTQARIDRSYRASSEYLEDLDRGDVTQQASDDDNGAQPLDGSGDAG